MIDKNRNATYNLATLEQDRFRLDGSFSFPDDTVANNGEVGFISSSLCDVNGVFSSPPTITIDFVGTHSSAGLTVTFDSINEEYATDFNASVYDAAGGVLLSQNVTGNTSSRCIIQQQIVGYKKVVITIQKWSAGNRRARVLEVDFGIVQSYTDSQLISMNLIEEMDMTSGQLPSPEFRFVVDNSSRAFNILNPTGFYKFLQQRQEVIPEMGVEVNGGRIEYVPLGKYLLWEWTSEEGSLTASFMARTNLDLMANYEYEQLTPSSKTLYQLAVQVFAICGITNYSIDPVLQNITTNSLAQKTDCRTLLQMIALAGMANIFVTRSNIIMLKRVSLGSPVDEVTFDNTYSEPKIELDKVVKQVDVNYWPDLNTSAVQSVSAAGVDLGDTLRLENNTLINTAAVAASVANWLLTQKSYRAKYTINWRGNPAQELADVIGIENTYVANMTAMIVKTSLTYQGYLSAQTEAKGAVN
ncbi:hypothetical protein ACFSL6_17660 [Paenibacillus thailandensis]|uniref:hypothetical protein n=1 Tax=Paenibacillus thailandensis TaxID=393250 RepID=UPI003637B933